MNHGSLPPPTQALATGASNVFPSQPAPLLNAIAAPRFTREPQPQPPHRDVDRERRNIFQPDFSNYRMCFKRVSTGGVASDGRPLTDFVAVPCPPKQKPEPPKKSSGCTLL